MSDFFSSISGLADTVVDMFDEGYKVADEYLGDVLPDLEDGFTDTVGDLIFGDKGFFSTSGSGGGGGTSASRRQFTPRSVGGRSVKGGTASREGDTRPLEAEDARAVQARWLARMDQVANITSKTKI